MEGRSASSTLKWLTGGVPALFVLEGIDVCNSTLCKTPRNHTSWKMQPARWWLVIICGYLLIILSVFALVFMTFWSIAFLARCLSRKEEKEERARGTKVFRPSLNEAGGVCVSRRAAEISLCRNVIIILTDRGSRNTRGGFFLLRKINCFLGS